MQGLILSHAEVWLYSLIPAKAIVLTTLLWVIMKNTIGGMSSSSDAAVPIPARRVASTAMISLMAVGSCLEAFVEDQVVRRGGSRWPGR